MTRWSGCLMMLVISCGGTMVSPPASGPRAASAVATASPDETSHATSCSRDDECCCRVFDGAAFQPGRAHSNCCNLAGCVDAVGASVPAGRCMTCVYD